MIPRLSYITDRVFEDMLMVRWMKLSQGKFYIPGGVLIMKRVAMLPDIGI